MPFFVITRLPSHFAAQSPSGAPSEFTLMAGMSAPHATDDEAERALAALRREQPDLDHVIVEADSPMEAMVLSRTEDGSLQPLEIAEVRSWDEMQSALMIRRAVFVIEQGVSEEEEIDEHDLPRAWGRTSVHVLGRLTDIRFPIATARLLIDVPAGELPHIGRVAVIEAWRRRGYGTQLMRWLEEEARRRGFPGVTLAAQLHAIPFYEAIGYVAHGPVFLDAGIEHREMELRWG